MSSRVWLHTALRDGAMARLEAAFEPAAGTAVRGASVVAPPHPLYGGRMDNPVVDALAHGLRTGGYAALRFNFRGCGASEGEASDLASHADDDYAAALAHVHAAAPEQVVVAGYSFGAAAALRALALDGRIARALVVAPPVSMLDLAALRGFGGPVDLLVGDDDSYAPLPRLEHALAGLERVRLHVLPDCDHFFSAGTELLSARLRQVLA